MGFKTTGMGLGTAEDTGAADRLRRQGGGAENGLLGVWGKSQAPRSWAMSLATSDQSHPGLLSSK